MNIIVNGENMTLEGPTTLEKLLETLGINLKGCAVELNREIVPRSEYASTQVDDADKLEIIQMVGGG